MDLPEIGVHYSVVLNLLEKDEWAEVLSLVKIDG